MRKLFESILLTLLANLSDNELVKQLQFSRVENQILRAKLPLRLTITARERGRLLQYGKLVGSAISSLITIVSPRTFARWLRGESKPKPPPKAKTGRPSIPDEVRELVLKLANETGWGYLRIVGELKKLGINISRGTVVNILREAGIDTGPVRGQGSWAAFIKRHLATLWATDFFCIKAWTLKGLVEYHVLFFIHLGSRRVHLAGLTTNPDQVWVARQARQAADVLASEPGKATHLIRDRDSKFVAAFDAAFEARGIRIPPTAPRQPWQNGYAERWVRSVKSECLRQFVMFGEAHLRHLLSEYVEHYNEAERPHQGMDNRPLGRPKPNETMLPFQLDQVVCKERLGGLLKHYHLKHAA